MKTKTLSDVINAHRTACEMAAKSRNLPQLVEWFAEEYGAEIPDSAMSADALHNSLLQFYT